MYQYFGIFMIKITKSLFICLLGTVTDGEFKRLRYEGDSDQPIHLYKLIKDSRARVSKLSKATLLKMMTKTEGK